MRSIEPYSREDLFRAFHGNLLGFSKHLLTAYSFAIGLGAKRMIDIGIGTTTRVLRMAALETRGIVYSCDNKESYSPFLEAQTDQWKFYLCRSEEFLREHVEGPIDFAIHDGPHDRRSVAKDLELLLPMMRTFGLIVVHDAHECWNLGNVVPAIKQATKGWSISMTILPYCSGLAVIRIEKGRFPSGNICPVRRPQDTVPFACPLVFEEVGA